jgi:hypothetical protein
VRFDVRKFAILLFLSLAAPAAEAQLWSGPAAVEIQVEDQKGAPVAEAQLKLQYKAVNPKDGPAPLVTDSRGRATVGGLAEGPWHLEVSREGFMTYIAEITVRTKGRPALEEALVLAGSGALRTLRVRISKGRSAPAPRAPEVSETATAQAPAPAPRPQITAPPEPVREEPAAPAVPAAPVPSPKPTQETAAPPVPKPAPTVPAPTPRPAPQPAPPAAQPAPPAAPAAPAVDAVRIRSSKDRTCPDCPPGESSMTTERILNPGEGGGGCGNIAAQLKGGGAPASLPAGCHVLRVTLPAGAKYSGYRYEIQDGGNGFDCPAGRDCPGGGRWPVDPVIVKDPQGTIVMAPFESGPARRERRAVLTVYFKGK